MDSSRSCDSSDAADDDTVCSSIVDDDVQLGDSSDTLSGTLSSNEGSEKGISSSSEELEETKSSSSQNAIVGKSQRRGRTLAPVRTTGKRKANTDGGVPISLFSATGKTDYVVLEDLNQIGRRPTEAERRNSIEKEGVENVKVGFKWTDVPNKEMSRGPFLGPNEGPSGLEKGASCSEVFGKITNLLFANWVRFTNDFGRESKGGVWRDITPQEAAVYVSIYLHMSIKILPTVKDYWYDQENKSEIVKCLMEYNRFVEIEKHFKMYSAKHASESGFSKRGPSYDPSYKVSTIEKLCNISFQKYYNPSRAMAIDENIIPTKSRNPHRTHNPGKPGAKRYGLRTYVLASSSGYIVNSMMHNTINLKMNEKGLLFAKIWALISGEGLTLGQKGPQGVNYFDKGHEVTRFV